MRLRTCLVIFAPIGYLFAGVVATLMSDSLPPFPWDPSWVHRKFNRSLYDAEHVAQGFANSLRDRVDPVGVVGGGDLRDDATIGDRGVGEVT